MVYKGTQGTDHLELQGGEVGLEKHTKPKRKKDKYETFIG